MTAQELIDGLREIVEAARPEVYHHIFGSSFTAEEATRADKAKWWLYNGAASAIAEELERLRRDRFDVAVTLPPTPEEIQEDHLGPEHCYYSLIVRSSQTGRLTLRYWPHSDESEASLVCTKGADGTHPNPSVRDLIELFRRMLAGCADAELAKESDRGLSH